MAGDGSAGNGVYRILLACRSAAFDYAECLLIFEVNLFAFEFCSERRIVLDLGTKTRSLARVIEICSTDGLEIFIESKVAPDRSPETCSVARNYCDSLSVFSKTKTGSFKSAVPFLRRSLIRLSWALSWLVV